MNDEPPADPQTWNRYAYVRNSPLNTVDPSGLDGEPDCWWGTFCTLYGFPIYPPPPIPSGFVAGPNPPIDWQTLVFGPFDPSLLIFYAQRCLNVFHQTVACNDPGVVYRCDDGTGAESTTGQSLAPCSDADNCPPPFACASGIPIRSTVVMHAPETPSPGCDNSPVWAGSKAFALDLVPIPPEWNPDPRSSAGDMLTKPAGQAATVWFLYRVGKSVKFLKPFTEAAGDYVPVAGWIWLGIQAGHAAYVGHQAYNEANDRCKNGG